MDDSDVKSDLKLLLKRQDVGKVEKITQRIIAYILQMDQDERSRRLEVVLVWFEHRIKQEDIVKEYRAFLCRLFDEVFSRQLLILLFENREALDGLKGRDHTFVRREDAHTSKEIRIAARSEFFLEFYRYTGESLERSMAFALYLLEMIGRAIFSISGHASALTEEQQQLLWLFRSIPAVVQETVLSYPSSEEVPTKRWLERIMENAWGNPMADYLMRCLFLNLTLEVPSGFDVHTFEDLNQEDIGAIREALNIHLKTGEGLPGIILSRKHVGLLRRLTRRNQEKVTRCQRRGEELLQWYQAHREQHDAMVEAKLVRIKEAARRWLRPGGFDHVEFRLTCFENAGIRAVIFRPEGYCFPDTGLDVIINLMRTPHLQSYHGSLEAFSLMSPDVGDCHLHDSGLLRSVLRSSLVDILYRLTTGERKLRDAKHPEREARDGSEGERNGSLQRIRPTLRRLPDGWRATDAAIARARDLGLMVGEGVTFVRGYMRGEAIAHDLPTEPFACYTEDDLIESLGYSL